MYEGTLSIVVPVRGGARQLAATVTELVAVAARHAADHEVILVDVSGDRATAAAVDHLAAAHATVMVAHHRRPRGYAFGLRDGWSVARGERVMAVDGGLLSAAALPRLMPYLDDHAGAVAYRVPGTRHPRAALYNAVASRLLGVDLHDPGMRLALFRADLAELIPPSADDTLVHAQLYAAAVKRGLPMAQVAVPARRDSAGHIDRRALLRLLRQSQPAGRPRAALMAAMLAGAGLWLLRRWRGREGQQ